MEIKIGEYVLSDWHYYLNRIGRDIPKWEDNNVFIDCVPIQGKPTWWVQVGSGLPQIFQDLLYGRMEFSSLEEAKEYVDTILDKACKLKAFW